MHNFSNKALILTASAMITCCNFYSRELPDWLQIHHLFIQPVVQHLDSSPHILHAQKSVPANPTSVNPLLDEIYEQYMPGLQKWPCLLGILEVTVQKKELFQLHNGRKGD